MPDICPECGKECKVIEVDFGIGSYEFWGSKGTDVNKQWVSDCCEAGPMDGPDRDDYDPRDDYEPELVE